MQWYREGGRRYLAKLKGASVTMKKMIAREKR